MSDSSAIAAFPMYDFPALAPAHDELWSVLSTCLERAGIARIPDQLVRHLHHEDIWAHPQLFLGQACEYPLAKSATTRVRLVATPRYRVAGCTGATYRSAIVVRRDDPAIELADLNGRRCVVNELTSNSGMNLLRAALAPIARGGQFFASVRISGSHRSSIDCIIGGQADVAAIDCVTLAHVTRIDPTVRASVRILDWTPSSPSLPFIAAATTPDATLEQIRSALRALTEEPAMDSLRQRLFLDGFDTEPDEGFSHVLQLERFASDLGYSSLH